MTTTVPASVTKASLAFREAVANQFELETDFLDTLCELYVNTTLPLVAEAKTATKKAAKEDAPAKVRQPRKKSAYNVYVREQMKTDEIKSIDHKSKMGAIAKSWMELNDEDKKVYTDMAASENTV